MERTRTQEVESGKHERRRDIQRKGIHYTHQAENVRQAGESFVNILTENKEEKKAGERQIQTSEPYRNRKRRKERHQAEGERKTGMRESDMLG